MEMKNISRIESPVVDHMGSGDAVRDAILAGYNLKSARAQQKQMITGVERMMRLSGRGRQGNPIAPNKADILPWYLYDFLTTAQAAAASVEYDFFTVPQGGTKTKVQTNLTQVSQLPAPQHFNCTSLQIYFASNMFLTDINSMLNNYYLEFWVGDKIYAEGPLFKYPSGAGLAGVSQTSGQQVFTNGIANCMAVVDFRMGDNPIGIHILQGQNFKVKILSSASFGSFTATASSGTGLNFYCILEGILSRGVQ
jgi:hypothetical protein